MPAAFVKSTGLVRAAGFSGTSAGSFGTLPAVGNHVVVGIALYDGDSGVHGIAAVTDNQGNTYAENAEATEIGGGNSSATIYSTKVATAAGTFTVTVDPAVAAGLYIAWAAAEFSGLDATTHLDRTATNVESSGASDASVTASAANTAASGLAVAVAALSFGDADLNIGDTPPAGYTNIAVEEDANAYMGLSFVYKVYSATETSAAAWTHDNESQFGWSAALSTYKAVAGGGALDITGVGNIAVPATVGTQAINAAGGTVSLTLTGVAAPATFGAAVVAPDRNLTLAGLAVPVSFLSTPTTQTLSWAAVTGATGYRIKWGTSSGTYPSSFDTGSTATTANVSSLSMTAGTPYYVVVCPLDGATEGAASPEIRIVPGGMHLSSRNQFALAGLAVPTAFGAGAVAAGSGAVSLTLSGAAAPIAFGTSVAAPEVNLTLAGAVAPTTFGGAVAGLSGGTVNLQGVGGMAAATAFGSSSILGGARTLTLPGLAVATLFGRPSVFDPLNPFVAEGWPRKGQRFGWINSPHDPMDSGGQA
jgi:hypothetical protein